VSDLIPFNFDGRHVRAIVVDGEPLVHHADACRVLEHSNPSMAIRLVDDEDKRKIDLRAISASQHALSSAEGVNTEAWFITESGLYALVFASKVKEARAFRRWVTHEVLPAIRKTGRYEIQHTEKANPPALDLTDLDSVAQVIQAAGAAVELARHERTGRIAAETKVLEQAPLVAQAQAHRAGVHDIARQEFAREVVGWAEREHQIKVLHRHVFEFLEHLGLFIKGDRSDQGHATTDAIRRGLAVTEKGTTGKGWNYSTGKLTPKGQGYAWDRIARHIETNGALVLPRRIGGAEVDRDFQRIVDGFQT
jgi:anti-repressor protein